MSRLRLMGLALAGLLAAVVFGAVAAYGFYRLDWGCPEQDRLRSPEEVETAFADEGLALEPTEIPAAVPSDSRVYRHVAEDAMVYVLVCRNLCSEGGPDTSIASYSADDGRPQRDRYGVSFANVVIWTTDADRRSARRLAAPVHRIVNDELAPPPPDRCYVG